MSSKNRLVVRERMNTVSRKRLYKANGHWAVATTGTVKQILCNYAWKHGAVVIKVDAYKTSQVEYGTNFVQKHSLDDPRTWVSEYSEKTIKRDLNAAKNILDWGLHPDHHYKVRKFKKVEPEMVADFV